jgi:transposase InsO family protein
MSRIDRILKTIYYSPEHPAGYGTVDNLWKAVKAKRQKITRRAVEKWLDGQKTHTLHRRIVRKFKRRKTIAKGPHEIYQIDLVDMSPVARENSGYRYILVCIDVFSRFAGAVPIKTKKAPDVLSAFKKVLKKMGKKPKFVQSDQGTEFMNKHFQAWLKSNKIHHYYTNSKPKAAIVERFNRTLRIRMHKSFTARQSLRYTNILDQLVESYNNRKHRILGTAPSKVNNKNKKEIFERQYGKYLAEKASKFKFKRNEAVRISRSKNLFEKGADQGWTKEIFTIIDRYNSNPPTYALIDKKGEIIRGIFYEAELSRVRPE